MALSNSDRITSTGLNRVISALWTKIKDTFAFDNDVVHNSGNENISGVKTFTGNEVKGTRRITLLGQQGDMSLMSETGAKGLYAWGYNNVEGKYVFDIDNSNNVTFNGALNGTASYAICDGNGNNIASTYAVDSGLLHTTGTESVSGQKTFNNTLNVQSSSSSISTQIKVFRPTGSGSGSMYVFFRSNGERGIYDVTKNTDVMQIDSSGNVAFHGKADNSTQWNGKSLVVGAIPAAASMHSNTLYISE